LGHRPGAIGIGGIFALLRSISAEYTSWRHLAPIAASSIVVLAALLGAASGVAGTQACVKACMMSLTLAEPYDQGPFSVGRNYVPPGPRDYPDTAPEPPAPPQAPAKEAPAP
jgi:hypothetical protein